MLSFSKPAPYSFEFDGKPYTLKALTFDDIDAATAVMGLEPQEQSRGLREFIAKRADKRTMEAIGNLPIPDVQTLFLDWTGIKSAGVTPGESEGSPTQ